MMTFTVEYEREDDGRWWRKYWNCRACLHMVKTQIRLLPKRKRWPCAFSLIVWSMEKVSLNSSVSPSLLHEPSVFSQSEARSRRA